MARTSLQELTARCKEAAQKVEVGGIYHHYSNPDLPYQVLEIAIQEATEEVCVVYKSLYTPSSIWVRNLDSWLAQIDVNGTSTSRFKKVSSSNLNQSSTQATL